VISSIVISADAVPVYDVIARRALCSRRRRCVYALVCRLIVILIAVTQCRLGSLFHATHCHALTAGVESRSSANCLMLSLLISETLSPVPAGSGYRSRCRCFLTRCLGDYAWSTTISTPSWSLSLSGVITSVRWTCWACSPST
jgi:hypothetical protein